MTILPTLKPSIATATPTVRRDAPSDQTREARRYADKPWRKWYGLKRWKDLRWDVLVDACFTCCRCGELKDDTSKLVADHVVPHRGRSELFWDRNNLQCMCTDCHDTVKQREEQSQPVGVWW